MTDFSPLGRPQETVKSDQKLYTKHRITTMESKVNDGNMHMNQVKTGHTQIYSNTYKGKITLILLICKG